MIKIFKVEGDSMYPFLKQGDRILCYRYFDFYPLHVGQVVVFLKNDMLFIKQVDAITDEGVHVIGSDAFSEDSRTFGPIEKKQIKYKYLFRF